MTIKVGDKVKINGEVKTIAQLLMPGGVVITTDHCEYFAGWDIIEAA